MCGSPRFVRKGWIAAFYACLLVVAIGLPCRAQAPPWRIPDVTTLPDDSASRLVRYGLDLLTHTSFLLGPDAQDTSKRFTGNGLDCASCHLDAGTQQYALPLIGVVSRYPMLVARSGHVETIEDRINDCMQRSMNSHPLPLHGPEMRALVAYLTFLSSDSSEQVQMGGDVPSLPLPSRPADPEHGAVIFANICAACHQPNGQGARYSPAEQAANRKLYRFPPLWGPDSYNDGAGMSHNIGAAWFIHANMPRGVSFSDPVLTAGDAYDVAAFINQQPRPHFAPIDKDYPNQWLKPADVASPPVLGPFSLLQHAIGPWQPIKDWLTEHTPR
jgi:thiosulfate dehydrogenase